MTSEKNVNSNEDDNEVKPEESKSYCASKRIVVCSMKKLKNELIDKPEILRYILKLKEKLLKRNKVVKSLRNKITETTKSKKLQDASSQTEDSPAGGDDIDKSHSSDKESLNDWKVDAANTKDEEGAKSSLSLVEQVKEAAENALQQTGMVYEATSGMYYDYNTGYYYNAELGLYYHGTTGCYYYFDKEQNQFVFHSQADTSGMQFQHCDQGQEHLGSTLASSVKKKNKKESRKKKIPQEDEDTNDRAHDHLPISKSKKAKRKDEKSDSICSDEVSVSKIKPKNSSTTSPDRSKSPMNDEGGLLEDGECPPSSSEDTDDASDSESDDSVANQYPPCMRIIIQETAMPKLKVGSLFLLTKDGGTLGREGSSHSIIIPEENVSRHHLTFSYDDKKQVYVATDMGSRNGTLLNGKRMSAAQQESEPIEIVHGSVIQLGGTKLLCHVHSGNSTCGHCEPGLLIRDSPPPVSKTKEYKSINLKKEHKREIQRLKTKYKIVNPKTGDEEAPQMPEGYEDKARKRREEVGSLHHGAKTEQASLDTPVTATNKGFKMLQKMGWQSGEGLGKQATGKQEPIPLVSNVGTLGLGCQPSSADIIVASTNKSKKDKSKTNVWLTTQKRFNMLPTPKAFAEDEDSEADD